MFPGYSPVEMDFKDQIGWGAQGHFRLGFGREEKTSLSIGLGYLWNNIAGRVKGNLGVGTDEQPIRAEFTSHYLSYELMFGWEPFSMRHDHIILGIGAASFVYL